MKNYSLSDYIVLYLAFSFKRDLRIYTIYVRISPW